MATLARKRRIAIVLPFGMTIRVVLETDVLQYLIQQQDTEITFVTPLKEHEQVLESYPHLHWADITHPAQPEKQLPSFSRRWGHFAYRQVERFLGDKLGFGNLHFRFHYLNRFQAHMDRMKMLPERQVLEIRAGNYVEPKFGKPLPDSWLIFRLLYWLYYAKWQANDRWIEAFFDKFQPDLLVLMHVQNERTKPYNIAARRRNIPILGIVASWDQPTSKGPVCPDIQHFIVQSNRMKQEMMTYHGVESDRITVVGWTQMDIYHDVEKIKVPRDEFFQKELNLPEERRLLVYGTYPERLGRHEPSIVTHLANQVLAGAYGEKVTLLIRPHPRDDRWEQRFMQFHNPPDVIVQPPEWGRLDYLTNLMCHTDVLLTAASTIALDAVAVDTPVIHMGFDGDLELPYYEQSARVYKWDHYRAIVEAGGTQVAYSYDELDRAICAYLENPELDSEGRARLRQDQLEPFDGLSSKRYAAVILAEASKPHRKPFNYAWLRRPYRGNRDV